MFSQKLNDKSKNYHEEEDSKTASYLTYLNATEDSSFCDYNFDDNES